MTDHFTQSFAKILFISSNNKSQTHSLYSLLSAKIWSIVPALNSFILFMIGFSELHSEEDMSTSLILLIKFETFFSKLFGLSVFSAFLFFIMTNGFSTNSNNLLEASSNHWQVKGKLWNIPTKAILYMMDMHKVNIYPHLVKYPILLKLIISME